MATPVDNKIHKSSGMLPETIGSYLQGQLDFWQQTTSVVTNTSSAIMIRQVEMMRAAAASTAHGLMMLSQPPRNGGESAESYAASLRQGSETIVDDMREINALSRECAGTLFSLYVERYRQLLPRA